MQSVEGGELRQFRCMKWIKVLKTGKYKDSRGVEHDFSQERLDRIVSTYNNQDEESKRIAPHVIGHPNDTAPAYGWVRQAKREGNALFVGSDDFADEFTSAVNKGLYKMRSISLYPGTDLIRHVGWLGAAQPAIPGLGEVTFAEDDDAITIDFMDYKTQWGLQSAGELFQRIRDWFIETNGLEKADEVISQWQIDTLKQAKADDPVIANDYKEQEEDDAMDKELQAKVDKLSADFAEAQTANATLTAERDQLKTDVASKDAEIIRLRAESQTAKDAAARTEFTQYCDVLVADGRMLPSERDFFIDELVEKSKASGDFASGESPAEKVKAMLEARASHGLFNKIATKANAEENPGESSDFSEFGQLIPERAALHARAKKVATEKNISFSEALDIVVAQEN